MSKKILICDDDFGILEMMEMVVEELGYQPQIQPLSVNLFKDLEVNRPDLILLDIWMPVLSGDLVLKAIKGNPKFSNIPVLMYSASTEGQAIAERAGADDYISKPFDMKDLEDKIKSLLENVN